MSNLIKSPRSSGGHQVIQLTARIDPELDCLDQETDAEQIDKTLQEKVDQARREADEIIKQAKRRQQEAERLIEEMKRRSELECQQAYIKEQKEGYQAGYQKGVEEGREKYKELIANAHAIVDQARQARSDYLKQAEPDILNLSMAVAGKIIGVSLNEQRGLWTSLVSEAVKEVREQETVKITVSPLRFQELNQRRGELSKVARDARVFIYADSDYQENDCTIETAFGKIDAGVDSQLMVIKQKLAELLEG